MTILQEETNKLESEIKRILGNSDFYLYHDSLKELRVAIRNSLVNFGIAAMIDSSVRAEIDEYCDL